MKSFIAAGALAAIVLTGCSINDAVAPDYVGVCVDRLTGLRLQDSQCAIAGTAYWDYVDMNVYPDFYVPSYGSRVNITNINVTHTVARGVTVNRNLSTGRLSSNSRLNSSSSYKNSNTYKSGNSNIQRGGFGVG